MTECANLRKIREIRPRSAGCGCDPSPNRHAKHFHKTHHPLIRSLEPGENWAWCYVDQVTLMPA